MFGWVGLGWVELGLWGYERDGLGKRARIGWMEGEEIWECRVCVSWMEANFSAWNELYVQLLKKRRILHAKSQQSQH